MVQIEINLVAAYAALVDEHDREITELPRVPVLPSQAEADRQKMTLVWVAPPRMRNRTICGLHLYLHGELWCKQGFDRHTNVGSGETLQVEINFMDSMAQKLLGTRWR